MLDDSIPPLDGQRVLVILEAAEELELDEPQNLDAWNAWVATGPQGPIAVDDEPAFPCSRRVTFAGFALRRRIVERSYLGPLIATLPEAKFPLVKAALIEVLGLA